MIRKSVLLASVALLVALFAYGDVAAQWTQPKACPGWNNPNSFTGFVNGGLGSGGYSGSGGVKNSSSCPNVVTGATGAQSLGPNYTASQMNTITASGCNHPSLTIPDQSRQFVIMTDVTGTDPNTANHLKYVPTQFNFIDTTGSQPNTEFTKSIRIGDGCANGSNYGVSLLNYDMKVTSQNAMLYLYYAVVAQAPTHGQAGNPTFIIRIMKKNSSGTWTQVNDTLAYYISATPSTNTTNACPPMDYAQILTDFNTNGWHNVTVSGISSGNSIYYKDWSKVAINLANYIYDTVRVQALIYDCNAQFHFAYAYIAGECRPMELKTEGCPVGLSTDVATISAPRGMLRYEWSASEYGVSVPANNAAPGKPNGYFTFRTLTMAPGTPRVAGQPAVGPQDSIFVSGGRRDTIHYNDYHVQASDFHVTYRPVGTAGVFSADPDSMGNNQTFRCRMTSALDPAKPFLTSLYVNVQNTKPSMKIDTLSMCDGTVRLWNQSMVPGDPNLVVDSTTTWSFFNNDQAFGTPDTVMIGDSADYHATNTEVRYVLVRTNTIDPTCYSEGIYPIKPLAQPKPGMTISSRVLCDSATTVLTDTTSNVYRRTWRFLKEGYNGSLEGLDFSTMSDQIDSVRGYLTDNKSVTRGFSHSVEPIELTVWNGSYYLNRTNQTDTIWCNATARDTVAVFVHPNLEVTGDTIVCEGSYTDAVVRTVGVDGCTYEWSLTPGVVTGDITPGDHLVVVPYADTSIYYVKVTSPQGCVAWGSVNAYYVQPKVTMIPPDGRICPGDTIWLMGSNADHYTWTASPSDPSLAGQETADNPIVFPTRSTVYTMVGHGSNDCDATPLTESVTVIPFPSPKVTLSPNYVDSDDPTVVLTNSSPNSVSTQWRFYDGQTSEDRSLKHTFEEAYAGQDSVVNVELTTANELGCYVVYPFTIPVHLFTAWLPTVFTPGSEDVNSKFKLFTINEYEYFHIYIYNREGMLVYESEDPTFEWDGTHNGTPCPQGAYVYFCNYRKPNVGTLSNRKGTVTLIR